MTYRLVTLPLLAAVTAGLLVLVATLAAPAAFAGEPTCSTTLGIAAHGQHVVGDYITGIGRDTISWPPSGGVVGDAIAGEGAAIPGGPGPGFHFPNDFAPGASLCLSQANSPGTHF